MARTIAIANIKGGSGKSTLTINLAHALALLGRRILLIDFDPQASITFLLGIPARDITASIYTAITEHRTTYDAGVIRTAIRRTDLERVDLVPATARLNLVNDELVGALKREEILKALLEPVQAEYDYILIDNMPYLGVLLRNALVAAGEVLIPLPPEVLATESLKLLIDQITLIRRSGLNPDLQITGLVLNLVDSRMNVHKDAVDYIRGTYGASLGVFQSIIRDAVTVKEAQAGRQSVFQYKSASRTAEEFRTLAQEVEDAC